MEKTTLDKEIILNATEEVIRRFGPDKANISDVAKSLNVSHAALYRYYKGKTALWNAVTERWLDNLQSSRNEILKVDTKVDVKLLNLLEDFAEAKRKSAINDPEMFGHYLKLAHSSTEVLQKSQNEGIGYIVELIKQGVDEGVFFVENPEKSAKAVYTATTVFMMPNTFDDINRKENIKTVLNLLINGLKYKN